MDKDIAVKLVNVSKTFYYREVTNNTIRQKVTGLFRGKHTLRKIEALSDISLTIKKGEFFGIIGHNGSGKSTLLKLIIGALKPDRSSIIETDGKILRLALGMGFDMNLSARHNIYVNGSIMGLTFKDIGNKFESIIDFAGLHEFVDTPIKFYSSGMVSRLAFAIAMHVETDVLLIDEYFGGVGDKNFQEKSEKIFNDRIIHGKTIVFVSHQMNLISKYCDNVCLLDEGRILLVGHPDEVLSYYDKIYND